MWDNVKINGDLSLNDNINLPANAVTNMHENLSIEEKDLQRNANLSVEGPIGASYDNLFLKDRWIQMVMSQITLRSNSIYFIYITMDNISKWKYER